MRSHPFPSLALRSLGLLAWALVGCQSETSTLDAPTAATEAAAPAPDPDPTPTAPAPRPASLADTADAGLPPAIEPAPAAEVDLAAPVLSPVTEPLETNVPAAISTLADQAVRTARKVEGAVDQTVRKTAREGSIMIGAQAIDPAGFEPPVVNAAKEQVGQAVGELGQSAQQVAEGVKQGARQTADEINQEVQKKADGLKQEFRQATDALTRKARDTTHKATSGLLKSLQSKAKETVKEVVPAPPAR